MSEAEHGLRQQTARGLKWRTIEIVGHHLLTFVVFAVLARLLQPADFGLLAIVATYVAFIHIVVDQGMSAAVVQREPLQPEHLDAAFWFNLACALVMWALTVAFADVLAGLAGEPAAGPLLKWGSLSLVINATATVHAAALMKELEFRNLTKRTLLGNTAGGAVGIAMALNGYGVWSLIGQQLVASAVRALYLWVVLPWRPSFRLSRPHLAELLSVSTSVIVTSVLWTVTSRIDQLVISRFAGAAVLGNYVVGGKLAEMARTAMQEPVASVSMPAMAKVQNDHERLCRLMYNAVELHSVVAFAVFGGLAAVAPTVVPLAFGAHWSPASEILRLISIYSLVVTLTIFFHPALLASGGLRGYISINVFCAIGSVAAGVVGVRFGIHVLIALMTLNMIAASWLALIYLRQRIGLRTSEFCRRCLVPAIAATLMFAAVTAVALAAGPRGPLWLRAIVQVVAGAVVYLGVVWALSPRTLTWIWQMATLSILPSYSGRLSPVSLAAEPVNK